MIALLAMGFVFLGNQRPVHAQVIPNGGDIDQGIFCFLDQFPTTDVFNSNPCGQTTAASSTLTVIKVVTGTSTPSSDFDIHITMGGTDIADDPGSSAGTTYLGLDPGAYSVSETVNAAGTAAGAKLSDYTATFSGCDSDGDITLAAGATDSCTITNAYNAPNNGGGGGNGGTLYGGLIVKKVILGSTVSPSLFSFTVNSGSATAFNADGENDMTLPVGSYHVAEVASSTYTTAYSGCLAPVVAANATTTCTITNTFNGSNNGGGGSTESDLTITKSASETAANVGDQVTYTITVDNAGPAAASGVSVTDQLPEGVTYLSDNGDGSYNSTTGVWAAGTIADEGSAVLKIVASVNNGTAGDTITNSATVSDTNGDSNTNNTATAPIMVNVANPTTSDISVTKTANNTTPNVGDTVTYTITANDSGMDATGVVIQDSLPGALTFVSTSTGDTIGVYNPATGDWTIGKLASTTTATLHIMATVNSGEANGTVITNTATVTAGDTSTDIDNSSSTVPVTVTIPNNNGGGGGTTPVTPTTPTTPGGGGGGGNGPIAGSYGGGGNGPIVPEGQVLGASTSTLPNSCTQYLTAFIRAGQKNDASQVERLQTFLNTYEGATLTVNGTYDAATLAATEKFQKTYGGDILAPWGIASPTGYVYLTTRKEVNTIYCHFTQNFPLSASQQAIINAARSGTAVSGTAMISSHPHASGASSSSGSAMSKEEQAAAAAAADMGMMGSSSSATGSSTQVTNNPLNGIGSFFSHLFGH